MRPNDALVETFAPLSGIAGLAHGFVCRHPETDVATTDREAALQRLDPHYRSCLEGAGIDFDRLALGEQVHGDKIALIDRSWQKRNRPVPAVDGLITRITGQALGIFVADCCPVWLIDPRQRAAGLVHSGRKGSELQIVARAIERMRAEFLTDPADLVVVLGPCIRPPNYEVDLVPLIERSCRDAGVPDDRIHDSGADTASDLRRYYSYRVEKGRTGRMLAFVSWLSVS